MSTQPDSPRVIDVADHAALLALNNAHAIELSWLDADAFARLLGQAMHARTCGHHDALLIALDQDAQYANPNFAWLAQRYRGFLYIDRVVVAAHARGRGLAGMLYRDLIDTARRLGHQRLVCEINRDPPNPASETFHRGMGFVPVGESTLANGKIVGYFALELAPAAPGH